MWNVPWLQESIVDIYDSKDVLRSLLVCDCVGSRNACSVKICMSLFRIDGLRNIRASWFICIMNVQAREKNDLRMSVSEKNNSSSASKKRSVQDLMTSIVTV